MCPNRSLHRPRRAARRLLAACSLTLGVLALIVALAAGVLPRAIPPDLSPAGPTRPRRRQPDGPRRPADRHAAVRSRRGRVRPSRRAHGRRASRWLAIATTLGAFAWLNYFLFPSLYSPYFYAGDVLRLGFFLALFVGGALELRRTQQVLATAAVLEERRRIARDIHDGVAQDLAYILQQGRRLAAQPQAPTAMGHMVVAAARALDESRHVIAALERSGGEPLIDALRATAIEAAGREGGRVEMDLDDTVAVPARTQEVLASRAARGDNQRDEARKGRDHQDRAQRGSGGVPRRERRWARLRRRRRGAGRDGWACAAWRRASPSSVAM